MKTTNALILGRNINVVKNKKAILKNIDIEINKNDFLTIIGPNGAGKTMLLKCLMEFYKPDETSPEVSYLRQQRCKLGGPLPSRRTRGYDLKIPPLNIFERLLKSTGEREISTTQALVQAMTLLCRDKSIGQKLVPIGSWETAVIMLSLK